VRAADTHRAGDLEKSSLELLTDRRGDVDAGGGGAVLAGVDEGSDH